MMRGRARGRQTGIGSRGRRGISRTRGKTSAAAAGIAAGWQEEMPKSKPGGKGKSKEQAGNESCFSWPSGTGSCAQVRVGGECAGSSNSARVQAVPLALSEKEVLPM